MFWSNFWGMQQFNQNSHLNELLKSGETNVEELLSEDNFLNDIKQIHEKFADYLIKYPHKLKKIIDYCLLNDALKEENSENNENSTTIQNKLPFIASEIFNGQPPNLDKFLFGIYTPSPEEDDQDKKSQGSNSQDMQQVEEEIQTHDDEDEINEDPVKGDQNDDHESSEQDIPEYIQTSQDQTSIKQKEEQEKENEQEKEPESQQEKEQEQEENVKEKEQEQEKSEEVQEQSTEQPSSEQQEQQQEQQIEQKVEEVSGEEILLYIFEFLDRQVTDENYVTCAGYFQKVLSYLISKEGYLFKFLQQNTPILKKFFNHLESRCISKIIIGLIIIEGTEVKSESSVNNSYNEHKMYDNDDQNESESKNMENEDDQALEKNSQNGKDEDLYLEQRLMIIKELFQALKNSEDEAVIENISYIMQEIIQYIVKNQSTFFQQLTEQFYTLDHLEILFFLLNQFQNDSACLTPISSLLKTIFQSLSTLPSNSYNVPLCDDDQVVYMKDSEELNPIFPFEEFALVLPRLLQIVSLKSLKNAKNFGIGRLEILDLLYVLIKSKSEILLENFKKSQIFGEVFALFKNFEWNSMIQTTVFGIIQEAFNHQDEDLNKQLFEQTDVLQFIMTNFGENKGFQGYLVQLANLFQEKQEIKEILNNQEGWEEFVIQKLYYVIRLQKDYQWGETYDKEHKVQKPAPLFNSEDNQQQEEKNTGERNFVQTYNNDYISKRKNLFDSSSSDEDEVEKVETIEDNTHNNDDNEVNNQQQQVEEEKDSQQLFPDQNGKELQQQQQQRNQKENENGMKTEESTYNSSNFWSMGVRKLKIDDLDDEDIEW